MKSGSSSTQNFYSVLYRRNPEVVTRKIAGELFIVPVKGKIADMQRIFSLNPVAEVVWDLLDGRHDLESILMKVLEKYDVEKDIADADIRGLIEELLQADLILE